MIDLVDSKYYQGNHIQIISIFVLEPVCRMILEHYDNPDYENTLFIVGSVNYLRQCDCVYVPSKNSYIDYPNLHDTYSRVIYYNLEHTFHLYKFESGSLYNQNIDVLNYLDYVDEIWTPWLETLACSSHSSRIDKLRWVPLRHTSYYEHLDYSSTEYQFDLLFLGSLTPERCDDLRKLALNTNFRSATGYTITVNSLHVLTLSGYRLIDIPQVVHLSKFLLDLRRGDLNAFEQNVVRIYDGLVLNKPTICLYIDIFSYFPNITIELDPDNTGNLCTLQEFINASHADDVRDAFKYMTYTQQAYDKYKQTILDRFSNFSSYTLDFRRQVLDLYSQTIQA